MLHTINMFAIFLTKIWDLRVSVCKSGVVLLTSVFQWCGWQDSGSWTIGSKLPVKSGLTRIYPGTDVSSCNTQPMCLSCLNKAWYQPIYVLFAKVLPCFYLCFALFSKYTLCVVFGIYDTFPPSVLFGRLVVEQ